MPTPTHPAIVCFHAGVRQMGNDPEAAELSFRQALALDSELAEAHANLGLLQANKGQLETATACYQRALALQPETAAIHANLGNLLTRRKHFVEAEAAYQRALLLEPLAPVHWTHLGVLYACLQREAEAECCQRTALAIDPEYRIAHFNLAYLQLRQGRFEEGWASLEARDWYLTLLQHLPCPRWQGEDLAGKSLLIGLEAGHGDMIQFSRYARLLKEKGAQRIGILCHPGLQRLFRTLDGADRIYGLQTGVTDSDWDFWSPPLSLPYHCGTRLETIPGSTPYLHATAPAQAAWADRLPAGLKVGLVWKGSSNFENDADRSLPSLDLLAPLGNLDGIHFISLQKGAGEDQARHPPAGLKILPLGAELQDFADTAALIANLDLVISVDTAVAHLSGALDIPCWILLPYYKADWRWLADTATSPWYPNSRLFRQTSMENWPDLVKELQVALEQFATNKANNKPRSP